MRLSANGGNIYGELIGSIPSTESGTCTHKPEYNLNAVVVAVCRNYNNVECEANANCVYNYHVLADGSIWLFIEGYGLSRNNDWHKTAATKEDCALLCVQ